MSQFAQFSKYLRQNLEQHPECHKALISLFFDMTNDWSFEDQKDMILMSKGISDVIDDYIDYYLDYIDSIM